MPRLLLILALVLFLGACSPTRLVYDRADWLLAVQIDSVLDLNEEQRARLDQDLASWLQQHRRRRLPTYLEFVEQRLAELDHGLGKAGFSRSVGELETLYRETLSDLLPALVDVLAGLGLPQRLKLRDWLDENNQEFKEQYLSGERARLLDQRAERTINRIEEWTGDLERNQVALVNRHSLEMPLNTRAWYQHRLQRQQSLLDLLDRNPGTGTIRSYLEDWLILRRNRPPALELAARSIRRQTVLMLTEIEPILNSDQKLRLREKLQGYRDLIRNLVPAAV